MAAQRPDGKEESYNEAPPDREILIEESRRLREVMTLLFLEIDRLCQGLNGILVPISCILLLVNFTPASKDHNIQLSIGQFHYFSAMGLEYTLGFRPGFQQF